MIVASNSESQIETIAEHEFTCGLCDSPAGTVSLKVKDDRSMVVVSSFTGVVRVPVESHAASRAQTALASGNAQTLYNLDLEFAPFYCPRCQKCYCQDHWRYWDVDDEDGWYDSTRGSCPVGHERMLSD
jgi:hypothetical protein